jgi:hypothetical protein
MPSYSKSIQICSSSSATVPFPETSSPSHSCHTAGSILGPNDDDVEARRRAGAGGSMLGSAGRRRWGWTGARRSGTRCRPRWWCCCSRTTTVEEQLRGDLDVGLHGQLLRYAFNLILHGSTRGLPFIGAGCWRGGREAGERRVASGCFIALLRERKGHRQRGREAIGGWLPWWRRFLEAKPRANQRGKRMGKHECSASALEKQNRLGSLSEHCTCSFLYS